jgi:hypothetical protein
MTSTETTIQISGLAKQQVAALRKQAKKLGVSAERYAKQLIENGLALEHRARTETFDKLVAPLRTDFKKSGMNGNELNRLVDAARTRHHEHSRRKKH